MFCMMQLIDKFTLCILGEAKEDIKSTPGLAKDCLALEAEGFCLSLGKVPTMPSPPFSALHLS